MSAIHFYDAITAGKSAAEGQIVRYDSLMFTGSDAARAQELNVALRDDVHVDIDAASQSELSSMDLVGGVSELDWARVAHQHFSEPDCLHVGYGTSTRIDPYIRYGLYRNLLPYPCIGLPVGTQFLDVDTLLRAIHILRPDEYPWPTGPSPMRFDATHHFLMWDLKVGGGNRAVRIRDLVEQVQKACPKLMSHALSMTSIDRIKNALGLDDGEVSDLDSSMPSFLVHPSLLTDRGFVLGMPVGIDITYPDILFVVDLQADLTQLTDPEITSYQGFVRQNAKQMDKPLVRVPLNRFPFCAPLRSVRPEDARRLQIDVSYVKQNIARLRAAGFIAARLKDAPVLELPSQPADAYHRLWAGDFSSKDQALMRELHSAPAAEWLRVAARGSDSRFLDLAVRMVWRESPEHLSSHQMAECTRYLKARTTREDLEPPLWVADLAKQAHHGSAVPAAAVGLLQLHERYTRTIG